MADPSKYVPAYSYSAWQALNPKKPLPADEVDNDFANVSRSVNQTIDALKQIRRSDGKLANQSVGPDQLSAALSVGFTFRGVWQPGQLYETGDGVVYNSVFYSARSQHVSSAENAPGGELWNYLFAVGDIAVAGTLSMPRNVFTGDGVTTAFVLTFTPVSTQNVLVLVGGVLQSTTEYSVNGNTLTIFDPPGQDFLVEVRGFATDSSLVTPADGTVTYNKLDNSLQTAVDKANAALQPEGGVIQNTNLPARLQSNPGAVADASTFLVTGFGLLNGTNKPGLNDAWAETIGDGAANAVQRAFEVNTAASFIRRVVGGSVGAWERDYTGNELDARFMQPTLGVLSQTPSASVPMFNSGGVKMQRIQRAAFGLAGFLNEGNEPGGPTTDPTENFFRPALGSASTVLSYSQIGHIGILGFSDDQHNMVAGSMGTIGVVGLSLSRNGATRGSESFYGETRNLAGGSGGIVAEFDPYSEDPTHTAVPSAMIPLSGPPIVAAQWLAAGGEGAGQPLTVACGVVDNGSYYKTAFMVREGAIAQTSWYSRLMKLAVVLAYDHDNAWFYNGTDKIARRDAGGELTMFKTAVGNQIAGRQDIIGSLKKHASDDAIALFGGIQSSPSMAVYSSGQIAFFGKVTPAGQQTLAAAATDAATTQTLANSLRTALINLGLGV